MRWSKLADPRGARLISGGLTSCISAKNQTYMGKGRARVYRKVYNFELVIWSMRIKERMRVREREREWESNRKEKKRFKIVEREISVETSSKLVYKQFGVII